MSSKTVRDYLELSSVLSFSCGVPAPDNTALYLLGGNSSLSVVTRYTAQGETSQLPGLKTGRAELACAGYSNDNFVLLVTGGWDGQ